MNFTDLLIKVHSWYPQHCCSDQDCKPVPCDQLIEAANGSFVWEGLTFLKNQVYPSLDQFCHVCHVGTTTYCAFIQNSF